MDCFACVLVKILKFLFHLHFAALLLEKRFSLTNSWRHLLAVSITSYIPTWLPSFPHDYLDWRHQLGIRPLFLPLPRREGARTSQRRESKEEKRIVSRARASCSTPTDGTRGQRAGRKMNDESERREKGERRRVMKWNGDDRSEIWSVFLPEYMAISASS